MDVGNRKEVLVIVSRGSRVQETSNSCKETSNSMGKPKAFGGGQDTHFHRAVCLDGFGEW